MFEMKREYFVGVDFIDEEHKELFNIANEAYTVCNDEFIADKFDHIMEIILRLKDYTIKHFADEEKYMEQIGYKRILSHKILHTDFIEKIEEIDFDQMDHNQTETLVDLVDFLGDWLIHHILEKDKLIVAS